MPSDSRDVAQQLRDKYPSLTESDVLWIRDSSTTDLRDELENALSNSDREYSSAIAGEIVRRQERRDTKGLTNAD